MNSLTLSGLDGQNPLGFLAALGLLRVLDLRTKAGQSRPRLSFAESTNLAQLETDRTLEQLVELVLEDAAQQAEAPILRFAYSDMGERVAPESEAATRDLKPPPSLAREFLEGASVGSRRDADMAAALFSELVQDNNKKTKPTGFHFTAGQQSFLQMVDDIRSGIRAADVTEALQGPWRSTSKLPSLSWDPSQNRLYALRANNPSSEQRGSVAAAYWLGWNALAFFPVVVRHDRLATTGIEGGWKDSVFRWPLWAMACGVPSVRSLLKMNLMNWTARERKAAGVRSIFASKILRSDQGGYGSFTPAEVVLPR